MGVLEGDTERPLPTLDSTWSVAGIVIATLILVLVLRYAIGTVIGRDLDLATILGTAGGAFGALLMIHIGHAINQERPVRPVRFWGTMLGDMDPAVYTGRGAYAHIVFGGVLGPLYPWLAWWVGVPGEMATKLPFSVLTALAYALTLTVAGTIALELFGDLGGSRINLREYLILLGLHAVYGITLGIVVGLNRSLFA